MGTEFTLVNVSKRECISFIHMAGSKARELTGNPAQAAVVTWYLLSNRGDDIQFVADDTVDWPFSCGSQADLQKFDDVTDKYINLLIEQGILKNAGFRYRDDDEPDRVYVLDLVNVWMG